MLELGRHTLAYVQHMQVYTLDMSAYIQDMQIRIQSSGCNLVGNMAHLRAIAML